MKTSKKKQPKTPLPQPETVLPAEPEDEMIYLHPVHIPPGVAISDIFLDAQDMANELHLCKRALNNMRRNGELSYTQLTEKGKVYYLKQEVGGILKQHIIIGKNSPLRKNGPKCISALIGLLSMCSFDVAGLVNMLLFA